MSNMHDRRRYTIAWICPLLVEYTAALQMLDEKHGLPQHVEGDSNAYTLGSIHGRNIIITVLGQSGNIPTAMAIAQMRTSFPELQFGLLVGIGGGAPSNTEQKDIRLGDVVVSRPASTHPGTVRYDQGKAVTGQIIRTGCLTPPPVLLLSAAERLEGNRNHDNDPIVLNLKRFGPKLQDFQHPGVIHDQPRDDESGRKYVVVHRGTIATGEIVIKDAAMRDYLAQQLGALCFETEAAGALYDFPCLVIRGISDYCDSHKNEKWHKYAAATAAAYARELLNHVPYQGAIRSASDKDDDEDGKECHLIATWLSPIDYKQQQQNFRSMHLAGTGQWLLRDEKFNQWLNGPQETLLFLGLPGCGKTVMISSVIHLLESNFSDDPLVAISYVYCEYNREKGQRPIELLLNILKQLFTRLTFVPECIRKLYRQYMEKQELPTYGQISRALVAIAANYERIFIVVDAVDETADYEKTCGKLLTALAELQPNTNVNILLSASRKVPAIEKGFRDTVPTIGISAPEQDIQAYLKWHINQVPFLSSDSWIAQQIKTSVLSAVKGR
ncbi:nucleoside phosphorylase domain-containing protein [Aspergillus varians]